MRYLIVLWLLTGVASADRDDVDPREVAAAKARKLSCGNLSKLAAKRAEYDHAPTLLAAAVQRCAKDRWSLEMLVCTTRTQVLAWCDRRWLTAQQKAALDAALDKAGTAKPNEKRQRAVNLALKNGLKLELEDGAVRAVGSAPPS